MRKKEGVRLFFMILPFIAITFLFCYVPIYGWIYAFFDYRLERGLANSQFVGFKHFTALVMNPIVRGRVIQVMRNTLAMAGIGYVTSFIPMFFAIALTEMRNMKIRRIVQTVTTIPNFISWVLVYALAFAVFNTNTGAVNIILMQLGIISRPINFLASPNHVWLTMWLYGTWKSLGWSAIIYIAALMGIDTEIYEAADIDGASRIQKIIYITIPGLLPTYFVLLILSIASFLSSGIEQLYVFQNGINKDYIETLDLYIYNTGIAGRDISSTTAIGILKTAVSMLLLFSANALSKLFREESIF